MDIKQLNDLGPWLTSLTFSRQTKMWTAVLNPYKTIIVKSVNEIIEALINHALTEILEIVCDVLEIEIKIVKSKTRKQAATDARYIFAILATENLPNIYKRHIANFIGWEKPCSVWQALTNQKEIPSIKKKIHKIHCFYSELKNNKIGV